MDESSQPNDDGVIGNPWKRLSRTVVYQNPWIVVHHDEVIRPDGRPGIYGVVHYRNRAVAVVAVDERDRILLARSLRAAGNRRCKRTDKKEPRQCPTKNAAQSNLPSAATGASDHPK